MAKAGIALISAMMMVAATFSVDAKTITRDNNEESPALDISFTNYGFNNIHSENGGEKGEVLSADRLSGLRLSVMKKTKEENGSLNANDKDVGQIKKGDSSMRIDNGVYGLAALIAVQKVY